jgi:hypothetical protein
MYNIRSIITKLSDAQVKILDSDVEILKKSLRKGEITRKIYCEYDSSWRAVKDSGLLSCGEIEAMILFLNDCCGDAVVLNGLLKISDGLLEDQNYLSSDAVRQKLLSKISDIDIYEDT